MVNATRLDKFLDGIRAELIELLISGETGSITIHSTGKNELRREINRKAKEVQMMADEMDVLRLSQRTQR